MLHARVNEHLSRHWGWMQSEGFGHDRKIRSAHFFELADQPIEVTMAVSGGEADRLFARLQDEEINIFYIKTPIEFGMTGER